MLTKIFMGIILQRPTLVVRNASFRFTFLSRQMCPSVYTKFIPNHFYICTSLYKESRKNGIQKGILVFLTKVAERVHTLFPLLAGARLAIRTFPYPYVGRIFNMV